MKFPYTKYGLQYDPRGSHVTLDWQDRTLLGEVTRVERHPVTGAILLTVRHFNGEPWPVQPSALAVDVLERGEYSATETACRGCMGPCGRCHEANPA